jgi:hypothetical protein
MAALDTTRGASGMLDEAACMSLLGAPYPASALMLYFELDAFLQHTTSDLPALLLAHNRSPARRRGIVGGMDLLPLDVDVVVEYDCTLAAPCIGIRTKSPKVVGNGVTLRICFEDLAPGVHREFRLPLQALMPDWGNVRDGYHCYTHSLVFSDPFACGDGQVGSKTFAGIESGGWMHEMEAFERIAFSGGGSSSAHATVARYLGDACVTLASELVLVNQPEDAALGWEEAQVDTMKARGISWNRLDGGCKGMRQLHRDGFLAAERASVRERDEARLRWRAWKYFGGRGPAALRGADADAHLLTYHEDEATPAQIIEARRLAARR